MYVDLLNTTVFTLCHFLSVGCLGSQKNVNMWYLTTTGGGGGFSSNHTLIAKIHCF